MRSLCRSSTGFVGIGLDIMMGVISQTAGVSKKFKQKNVFLSFSALLPKIGSRTGVSNK